MHLRLIIILLLITAAFTLKSQDIAITPSRPVRMVRAESGFALFSKAYVANALDEWQQQKDNESYSQYKKRTTKKNRNIIIPIIEEEAREEYLELISKTFIIKMDIVDYDYGAEMMILDEKHFGHISVAVPPSSNEYFQKSWNQTTLKPEFFLLNDTLGLASVQFILPNGEIFNYTNPQATENVFLGISNIMKPVYIFGESVRGDAGKNKSDDIDKNIPTTDTINDKTWVVIIANENYRYTTKVKYAKRDAETFKNYCIKTFGVPKRNIRFVQNARKRDFESALQWIENKAKTFGPDIKVIFYYVGHGTMSQRSKKSFFVPTDGRMDKVRTCFSVDYLIENIGALPVESAVLFVDASFNCHDRKGNVLITENTDNRSNIQITYGNVAAVFACQGNENAYQHESKKHGVFTYFLLSEIQQHHEDINLENLYYEVQNSVKTYSLSEYKTMQTPTIMYSSQIGEAWRKITF